MGQETYTACRIFSIFDAFSLTGVKKEAANVGEAAQRGISEHELETRPHKWAQILALFIH